MSRVNQHFDDEDDEDDDEHLRRAALAVVMLLGAEEARRLRNSRRHRLYLCRPELMPNPRAGTPWQRLYHSRNDRAYITTMGFDVATFDYLLESGFSVVWNLTPIPRDDTNPRGNARTGARSLDAAGALGLCLHFLNSTMSETSLQEIFALIPSTVNRYLRFARRLLLDVLRALPEGTISWPQGDEFEANSKIIQARHPLLKGAFGTMDGLSLATQTSSDPIIENATYNGWHHSHCTSSVFAFGPQGTIIACNLNAPGSWHDSRVARPIFQKLHLHTPPGYYLVTDTAFPRGTIGSASAIKAPIKAGQRLPDDPVARAAYLAFDRQLLSYRQSAEWGMRALQGSFGRLRIPLNINDDDGRGDLLEMCARLNNIRANLVGINQIRNVYVPIWQQSEAEELWHGFERMLFRDIRAGDRVSRFHLVNT